MEKKEKRGEDAKATKHTAAKFNFKEIKRQDVEISMCPRWNAPPRRPGGEGEAPRYVVLLNDVFEPGFLEGRGFDRAEERVPKEVQPLVEEGVQDNSNEN